MESEMADEEDLENDILHLFILPKIEEFLREHNQPYLLGENNISLADLWLYHELV
jgi:hypothetical protein